MPSAWCTSDVSQRRRGCVAAFWLAIFTPMSPLKMSLLGLCSPYLFLTWLSLKALALGTGSKQGMVARTSVWRGLEVSWSWFPLLERCCWLQEVWTAPKAWVSPAWPLPQLEHTMGTWGRAGWLRELSMCPGAAGGAKGRAPALGSRRLRGATGQPRRFLSLPSRAGLKGARTRALQGRAGAARAAGKRASQGSHLAAAGRPGQAAPRPGLWDGGNSHCSAVLCRHCSASQSSACCRSWPPPSCPRHWTPPAGASPPAPAPGQGCCLFPAPRPEGSGGSCRYSLSLHS